MLYLDPAYHCIAYDQFNFDIISHIQNEELIPDIIPNLYETCTNSFFNNENFSHSNPVLTTPINTIMNTMTSWCDENQKEGNLKGFVTYAYSHSKSLRFSESVLQNNLCKTNCEDFHETVIVYNPTKQVVFLMRIAIGKNLEDEIKLSTNDMIKFVFTFFDILDKSGVKLINLLVTDKGLGSCRLKCNSCEHQVISIESFGSSKTFDAWWENKEQQFSISVIHRGLNRDFSSHFLAKLGRCIAPLQFSKEIHFPGEPLSHLNYSIKKVAGVLELTPEQSKIVYLPQKHLIIRGNYGSGKTVVACKRAELIARSMTKEDSLYYIICDSRSMLKEQIQHHPEINIWHNIKREQENTIVEQILHSDSKNGKINLIFDEFYGENLGEKEVKKLNQQFKKNERLKDSHIIFIAQPFIMKNVMLETLDGMNLSEILNDNMRNSMAINSLVAATGSALEDQSWFYPDPDAMRKKLGSLHQINTNTNTEIPNLYEIPYTEGKVKLKIIILMFILRKVMNVIETGNQVEISHIKDLTKTQETKKLVILHFDAQNDIPHNFDTVFRLMGISKRVTTKYDEFKEDPKKQIFICNHRTVRGLEYSHVIVVLDSSLFFLQHNLPECFSRCTAFLHIIVLKVQSQKRNFSFERVLMTWKKSFDDQKLLVMPWKTKILEFEESSIKTSQPVDAETSKDIKIRIKADVYAKIKKEIDKISFATADKLEDPSKKPKGIEIRLENIF